MNAKQRRVARRARREAEAEAMLGEPKVTFIDVNPEHLWLAPQSLERAVRQRLQTMVGDLFHSPDYGISLTSLLKPRKP